MNEELNSVMQALDVRGVNLTALRALLAAIRLSEIRETVAEAELMAAITAQLTVIVSHQEELCKWAAKYNLKIVDQFYSAIADAQVTRLSESSINELNNIVVQLAMMQLKPERSILRNDFWVKVEVEELLKMFSLALEAHQEESSRETWQEVLESWVQLYEYVLRVTVDNGIAPSVAIIAESSAWDIGLQNSLGVTSQEAMEVRTWAVLWSLFHDFYTAEQFPGWMENSSFERMIPVVKESVNLVLESILVARDIVR